MSAECCSKDDRSLSSLSFLPESATSSFSSAISDVAVSAVESLIEPLFSFESCLPEDTLAIFQDAGFPSISTLNETNVITIFANLNRVLEPLKNESSMLTLLNKMTNHSTHIKSCTVHLTEFSPYVDYLENVNDILKDTDILLPLITLILEPLIKSLIIQFFTPIQNFAINCPSASSSFQKLTGPLTPASAFTEGNLKFIANHVVGDL